MCAIIGTVIEAEEQGEMGDAREVRTTFMMLRTDAIARGHQEVAIAYGDTAIRIGFELLDKGLTETERQGAR
jgi:hypothetical protein